MAHYADCVPSCIPEDGFRPQAPNLCIQGTGNNVPQEASRAPHGQMGCAAERLLGPSNQYTCDQNKVHQQQAVKDQYAKGVKCDQTRPGYNTSCPVPLWSRNKLGFKGAVPYTGPYETEAPYRYAESPYYMDNDDPRKFFMSGYTGFVPNTQSIIGNVSSVTSNKGLRTFSDRQCKVTQNFCKPVLVSNKNKDFEPPVEQLQKCSREPLRTINVPDIGIEYNPTILLDCGSGSGSGSGSGGWCGPDPSAAAAAAYGGQQQPGEQPSDGVKRKMKMFKRKDPHPIYRVEEGLLPTYGGHVPNQQFRFGGTFGRETLNARNLSKRRSAY